MQYFLLHSVCNSRNIGAKLGNKFIANEEDGDIVVVLIVDEDRLSLSDEVPIPDLQSGGTEYKDLHS